MRSTTLPKSSVSALQYSDGRLVTHSIVTLPTSRSCGGANPTCVQGRSSAYLSGRVSMILMAVTSPEFASPGTPHNSSSRASKCSHVGMPPLDGAWQSKGGRTTKWQRRERLCGAWVMMGGWMEKVSFGQRGLGLRRVGMWGGTC